MAKSPRILLGLALLAAALPASAEAATVTREGTTLVYTGTGAERNHLNIESLGSAVADLHEQNGDIAITSRTSGCARGVFPGQPDRAVRCGLSGVTAIEVRLGDGDDSFSSRHPIATAFDGGRGDDSFFGKAPREGTSQVRFRGGPGRDLASYQTELGAGISMSADDTANDGRRGQDRDDVGSDVEVFRGSPGATDFIQGSGRDDVFHASDGADTITGLGGDDLFVMGPRRDGATRAVGGTGRDTVSYAERGRNRITGVNVSPDSDASTDGETGEGDDVEEAEVIEGGPANDTIVTPGASENGYRLVGGGGHDFLATGAGRDRLIGGAGEDTLHAGPDRDVIEALDQEVDARLDCGSGGPDQLFGDFREARSTGCEIRQVPKLVGTVGVAAAPAAAGTVRLRLSWRHPADWRRLRSVVLDVHDGQGSLGRLVVRPRKGRASATGRLRTVRGARLARRGGTVRARALLRLPSVAAGPLRAHIVATDHTGRRQAETRDISTTNRSSR